MFGIKNKWEEVKDEAIDYSGVKKLLEKLSDETEIDFRYDKRNIKFVDLKPSDAVMFLEKYFKPTGETENSWGTHFEANYKAYLGENDERHVLNITQWKVKFIVGTRKSLGDVNNTLTLEYIIDRK